MADSSEQEKDAWTFAQRAVQCDQQGLAETAIFYYMVSGGTLGTHSGLDINSLAPGRFQFNFR